MSLPDWREAPISKAHDRESFDCGEPELTAMADAVIDLEANAESCKAPAGCSLAV